MGGAVGVVPREPSRPAAGATCTASRCSCTPSAPCSAPSTRSWSPWARPPPRRRAHLGADRAPGRSHSRPRVLAGPADDRPARPRRPALPAGAGRLRRPGGRRRRPRDPACGGAGVPAGDRHREDRGGPADRRDARPRPARRRRLARRPAGAPGERGPAAVRLRPARRLRERGGRLEEAAARAVDGAAGRRRVALRVLECLDQLGRGCRGPTLSAPDQRPELADELRRLPQHRARRVWRKPRGSRNARW